MTHPATTYNTTEIFTPALPAVHTFVERDSLNEQLVDSLMTPGKQIVIFGQTGTGKTTLLHNKLNQIYEGKIRCSCTTETTFDQILLDAFDQLEAFYISERSKNKSIKLNTKLENDFKVIKGELGGEFSKGNETKLSPILPPQLTPARLARFIGEINCCWVIEDIHKISTPEKVKVSQIMKVFMDHAVDYKELKIILVGAVGTAKEILTLEKDMKNRTLEIPVPLLSQEELKKIIQQGESLLNIGLEYGLTDAITKFSCGLASVTHQLCLNLCLNKNIYTTCDFYTELTLEDFRLALQKYVSELSDSLKQQYERIEEFSNTFVINILRELLKSKHDFVSHLELKTNLSKSALFNDQSFSDGLEFLTKEEILNHNPESNSLNFLNPFFKVFCHCNIELADYRVNDQLDLNFETKQNKEKEMVRMILKNGGYSDVDF